MHLHTSKLETNNGINNYYTFTKKVAYLYYIQCEGCLHIVADMSISHDGLVHCRWHLLHTYQPDMLEHSGFVCIYRSHCSLSPSYTVVFVVLQEEIGNSKAFNNTIY